MSKNKEDILTVKKVFIGSPGDLMAERRIFRDVIDKVNKTKARSKGILLEAVGWEDTLPGKGRPQKLINRDVIGCDLMVMLLWKRWGSSTGKYSSGFEEEFEVARKHDKETWLHFRDIPGDMMADPGEQLREVLDFRDKIEKGKEYLYKRYADEIKWREMFEVDLSLWLDDVKPVVFDLRQSSEYEQQIADKDKQLDAFAEKMCEQALELADAGQLTKAEELFAHACANSSSLYAWNTYGLFLLRVGSLSEAEKMFRQVIDLAEPSQKKMWQAIAHGNLGLIYETRGDLDKAEEMCRKSLAINDELGSKKGMAAALGNLGLIYWTRGDFDKAEEMYRKSLAIDENLEHKEGMANQYGNLGNLYLARGDLDKAEEMYRKSLAIEEELGRKEGMASDYGNLGIVFQIRGDLDKAEEMCRKSLAINDELGRKEGMASDYGNLGIVFQTRGDLDKAEEMHRKSLAINDELGRKEGMGNQYCNLGNLYEIRGDLDKAEIMYQRALELFTEVDMKPEIEKVKDLLEKLRKKQ